jgi:hypothetical protein
MGADPQPKVGAPAKLTGQTELVRQLSQYDSAGVADDPLAVAGDFEPGAGIGKPAPAG